ncbi:cobalt-precorrin 5A hydrolase [Clostridium sp. AF32-12BH]|uniref:cobalt-precorrin 5A hydrolase n=1 Tax=Clostridium sp. AF32-12BH TaxID=2292006 RepID=UPI000E5229BD|nr:cobalt-precorrin 5A hydrolase [Clostridium sp. AF32-12BH]RHP49033.1 cobalamin biosynthesis protein CbiG [Clostridium sp. AF32-12BH]
MKLALIGFTGRGAELVSKLVEAFCADGDLCTGYTGKRVCMEEPKSLCRVTGSLSDWTRKQFSEMDGLIFVGAAGIAVRLIAPYLKDKLTDPAVVVVDEAGHFAISLLSGHVGGANHLAEQTARILGAIPVVTTASDVRGRHAIDVWAKEHHLTITDRNLAKEVAAALLGGETVGYFSEYPLELPDVTGYEKNAVHRRNVWITCHVKPDVLTDGRQKKNADITGDVLSGVPDDSDFDMEDAKQCEPLFLRLVPKSLILGIGCRKQTLGEAIEFAVQETLRQANLDLHTVAAIASIDLKKEETGLLQLSEKLAVPFITYTSSELETVQGDFSESGFVRQVTGVGNVCERSALLCAGKDARLLVKKQVYPGVTVAVAEAAFCG